MSIKIHVERIKKYKITSIETLPKNRLPNEYLNCAPWVYKNEMGVLVLTYFNNKTSTYNSCHIYRGDELTESELRLLINRIRLAGERLSRINHKNDKREKKALEKQDIDWSGLYTFEV